MKRLPVLASALLLSVRCLAAAPALDIPDEPLSVPGAGLPANFLLNFAVTVEDAGAAYRQPYRATRRYQGYFNSRLCYRYPMKAQAGSASAPDLDERGGHFSPSGAADARHECRAAFSGNFLNWASMSTLDLLRVALTGGDRVIDEPGTTVLQRAWLPDGRVHPDFYASPDHFPRKSIPLGGDSSAPSAVTPFGTDRLFIVSCRNRLLFSNTADGKDCDSPRIDAGGRRLTSDKFFGEFNARVQVCTPEDAALRRDLCARYRGGYKPQGVLQQATQRVGVMGYLTQLTGSGSAEYGGALRAPLKLLGPEWQADSGILAADPDKQGIVSGAINYINRLGRGNAGRPGAYSRGDPGAELYYEALRYLQGRPSSMAAGATSDDGLPVWRTASDPVAFGCQRNIIATIGHAAFSKDRFVPGNSLVQHGDSARPADAFAPGGPFDVMQATRTLGELEAASGAGPRAALSSLDRQGAGAGGAGSYYLAGAAYWAHTNPIRPDKPARVDSHALELGAGNRPPESALYYAAKYGAFDDRNRDGNPNITTGGAADATEWSEAAAKPRHYHAATSPDDIIPAVRALFGNLGGTLIEGLGAVGAGYLIDTRYDSGNWSGTVQRRTLRIGADGAIDRAVAASWDAGLLLTGTTGTAPAERKLYTLMRQPGQAERTTPFRWAELPPDVRTLFDSPGGGVPPDGLAQARVGYLRGERSMEAGGADPAGTFRRRSSILGDIVGSVPLIIGAPSAGGQGPAFAEFRERGRQRRPAVYVGANDGMLHAFDAATGRELFAYLPNAILPALSQLTSPAYRHRAYVDGSPGQGEAVVRGRWRTVLASGFGLGARGLFALDVTDPAAFETGLGALWEFTERDDPAIGHVSTPPRIVKLNIAGRDSAALYRYFVLVASGINPATADGTGALFLLALDKPPDQPWQAGLNYYKFVTPAGDPAAANALSAPALAIAGDGSARYAYAGDLQGRLWRVDLTGKPPWGGALDRPLFVARAGGATQPIAHAPALVFAPGGGYLVLFATGRYLERADTGPDSFTPQSFYALHDRLQAGAAIAGRGAMEPRTVSGSGPYLIKGKPVSYTGEGARQGWYLDFPNPRVDGERAAGSPVVRAGAVLFDTLLPSPDGCIGPTYRSYVVDALSGMALGKDGSAQADAHTGELLGAGGTPTSVVFKAPALLEIGTGSGPRNASGTAVATRRYALVRPGGTAQGAPAQQVNVAFAARRLSWRQVANWKDLHDKVKR